jgi:hypothetical protein
MWTLTLKARWSSSTGSVETILLERVGSNRRVGRLNARLDVAERRADNVDVQDLGAAGGGEHDWSVLAFCALPTGTSEALDGVADSVLAVDIRSELTPPPTKSPRPAHNRLKSVMQTYAR